MNTQEIVNLLDGIESLIGKTAWNHFFPQVCNHLVSRIEGNVPAGSFTFNVNFDAEVEEDILEVLEARLREEMEILKTPEGQVAFQAQRFEEVINEAPEGSAGAGAVIRDVVKALRGEA